MIGAAEPGQAPIAFVVALLLCLVQPGVDDDIGRALDVAVVLVVSSATSSLLLTTSTLEDGGPTLSCCTFPLLVLLLGRNPRRLACFCFRDQDVSLLDALELSTDPASSTVLGWC